jgi:DNA-binding CsgD family transcriptional regulator
MDNTQFADQDNLIEAKKLLEFLLQPDFIEDYKLTPREEEVTKMKWTYKLSNAQIAEKLGIKENSVKQLNSMVMARIFHRIESLENHLYKIDLLNKEIENLKNENQQLKKKFEALYDDDKNKFESLDVVIKNVSEVGFSEKAVYALTHANIRTVRGMLQYRLSSLLLMKHFNVSIIEELEQFMDKHHLKIKI